MSLITPYYIYGSNRLISGSGGGSNVIVPNTVFVSSAGNNATAIRNRFDKPCADIATAKTLASSGDRIQVLSDLTNQTILNDSAKNLSYEFFGACSISFVDDIVNITTAVSLKVYGGNSVFTGNDIVLNNNLGTLIFEFDTWNQSGVLSLLDGSANIKGRYANKTNTGNTFIFGYSDNENIIEIENWVSTSTSISYFTSAVNTTLQNSKLTFSGLIRANIDSGVANNVIINNCTIICSYFEFGNNSTNSYSGVVVMIGGKLTSTSATKGSFEVKHTVSAAAAKLVLQGSPTIISTYTYSINNPTAFGLTVLLEGYTASNKIYNAVGLTLPIVGSVYLADANIQ